MKEHDFRAITGFSGYNGVNEQSAPAVLATPRSAAQVLGALMPPKDTPTLLPPTTSDLARFDAKVRRTDSCWEWTGAKRDNEYGSFKYRGKTRTASRVAWLFAHGEWPGDLCVCHTCDNPSCVRPDHLFLGTDKDNAEDRDAKGRQRNGASYGKCIGEGHGRAKLTQHQVDLIRSGAFDGLSQREIADQFGVSGSLISMIKSGKKWARGGAK